LSLVSLLMDDNAEIIKKMVEVEKSL